MDDDLPSDKDCAKGTRDWPHAPPHRLQEAGVYLVTARARDQKPLLAEAAMKDWFQDALLAFASEFGWQMEAWAILSNHYHFVALHSENAGALSPFLQKLHSFATKERNRRDGTPGRSRLWQNYRETHLTHQHSYLARLNYVHQNAVHHGLVRRASDWQWGSARRFKESVTTAWVRTIASFRFDDIARLDGD